MAEATPEDHLVAFAQCDLKRAGDALEIMSLSLFDWAACAMAGAQEPVTRIVRDMCVAESGSGPEIALGHAHGLPSRAAALLNGAASHALDYDDTHFDHIGHPSVAVIPAALAVSVQANGQARLEAALIGAEASIRVGMWLGRAHYQVGFHQTATAGAIGATLACARLLRLNEDQTLHALGIAATRAAGLKSQFGTMGKPYHAGLAAATGVEAATLAKGGFVSNPLGLSGAQGFGPTHHGQADMRAFETLGTEWRMEAISHKFHACCHGLHAMLEALAEVSIAPQDIERIEVRTNPCWLSVCNLAEPQTGLEAKFSYALTAAMALSGRDTAALETYTDALTQDPGLIAVRDRVQVVGDDSLSETETQVTVTSVDGTEQRAAHDLRQPIPLDIRADKLRRKAKALVGEEAEGLLWNATAGKRAPNLDALNDLFSGEC